MIITPVAETKTSVTISRSDWEKVLDRIDDRVDRDSALRSESQPDSVRFTADETRQIVLDGVSPLRILRARAKMSQGALAKVAGIGTSYVSEIEAGKKPGSVDALTRIAEALGVDVAVLLIK